MQGLPPKVVVAAALDPRFKRLKGIPHEEHARVWTELVLQQLVSNMERMEAAETAGVAKAAAAAAATATVDLSGESDGGAGELPAAASESGAADAGNAADDDPWSTLLGSADTVPAVPPAAALPAAAETEYEAMKRRRDIAEREIRTYYNLDPLPHSRNEPGDPLAWWQKHSVTLPHLGRLARTILCIPATSASAERLFSSAGLTITAKRSRLEENAERLVFLRSALPIVKEYEAARAAGTGKKQNCG
jgi:hypothetical protein